MVLRKKKVEYNVPKERRFKTRRSKRKNKDRDMVLKILGTNADGLNTKKESFKNLILNEKPTFFIYILTKMKKKNQN